MLFSDSSSASSMSSALIGGVMYREDSLEAKADWGGSCPVGSCSSSVAGKAPYSSKRVRAAFVFFSRLGVISLGDEEEERAAAAKAFLFLPVDLAALAPVVLALGLRMRWMLVLKEIPVIGFPSGLKSVAALSHSV